ncbi:cysteine desulfurase family protein [Acidaminococcus fermentans]|uniref:cysteine desulfurase family protein n=1 Tax=Acidaminococcus fermentans TaxID=905 RepID=UPI003A8CBEF0
MFVYADNAATTRVLPKVLEAMLPYFTEQYGNPSSTYPLGQEASRALIGSRETIAGLLGCRPGEITFTSGGSEADNQILRTAATWGKKQGRTHLISSAIEHHAILHTLEALQAEGFTVTLLPVNREGQVEPAALEQALTPETALVSIMAANNETGAIQPIARLAALAHARGALFHTDAVQALGHIPLTLKDTDIDFLSGSAHKFHGPKGVGILFARRGIELESLIFGGEQERGKRAGTENVPGIVGMAAALEEAIRNLEANASRMAAARDALEQQLLTLPGTRAHSGQVPRLPGHLNMAFDGVPAEALLPVLGMAGICVSAGSACASGSPEPSHVLLALGCTPEEARCSLRFSLGDDITLEQVHFIVETVTREVARLRKFHQQA